jgi:thiaminase/transcriptional activator TenA
LLPCFWIYKKVGDYISENQVVPNPYQNWINAYSGEDFAKSVNKMIDLCDQIAEAASEQTRRQMIEAYQTASRLEYIFWDSAYRLEEWGV